MTRIVSLLPSATEIVCALGMRDALVGVSHECDFPPDVQGLPRVTSTKIRPRAASAAIDRDVRRLLQEALAVYDVDTGVLARLQPDVIVTQDLCDVCAVSLDDVRRAAREVLGGDVRIVNLRPTTLAEIRDDIRRVAAALGRAAQAEALLADQQRRVEDVRARAAALPRPGVLAIEWIDPVMVGGMWSPELIELAGGRPLGAQTGTHAPTLDVDALRALAPDVIVLKPCGFDIPRMLEEEPAIRALLAAIDAPATRAGNVWLTDGNAYFNRPGPRIVDSLETLAACVHPDAFADLAVRHAAFHRRL